MKFARLLATVALGAITFISCSDDPFVPTGPYVAPEYHATLQSLSTPFSTVCGAGEKDIYAFGGVLLHYDGSTWAPIPFPVDTPWSGRAVGFASGEIVFCNGRETYIFAGTWNRIDDAPIQVNKLWANAPDDLYVLGWAGMYHYTGAAWEHVPVSRLEEIQAISGDEAGHPIMCGALGRIDRSNGTDWTSTYLDSMIFFNSVAVNDAGRTFVASGSIIYEVIGNTLNPILENQIREAQLQTDGETLYAAGRLPYPSFGYGIAKYRNGIWTPVSQGSGYLTDFWAGNEQLAGVGENSLILHGTPAGVAPVHIAPSFGEMNDAVSIGDAIYTIGEHAYRFQDDTWTNLDKEYITRNTAYGIGGRDPDNIYAVGPEMILHYNGVAWEWVNAGLGSWLRAVCVEPNGNVVAVGGGPVIVEYDGTSWTKRQIPFDSYDFFDVASVGNTIFAVGDNGLVAIRKEHHWYLMQPTGWDLRAVWGYDERHVYAASAKFNEICFYDGNRWEPINIEGPSLASMISIWGTSPQNIFILDYDGTLAHFNGASWSSEERVFGGAMRAVTGTTREVLTVGRYGSALYTK